MDEQVRAQVERLHATPLMAVVAVAVTASVTINLGPLVRARAEAARHTHEIPDGVDNLDEGTRTSDS